MTKTLRLGAVNWDAAVGEHSYFGGNMLRSLGKEVYEGRLPFFATKEKGGYRIPLRTPADCDRELSYAKEGGIDYFAYCRYPEGEGERTVGRDREEFRFLAPHLPELNFAYHRYRSSTLADKINNCAIVFSCHAYAEADLLQLARDMEDPHYERVDGKPLVYLYGGYDTGFLTQLRGFFRSLGEELFIVLMGRSAQREASGPLADAVSGYSSCHAAKDFREFCRYTEKDNEDRLTFSLPVIPLLSMGWNPTPRIDEPCPWGSYRSLPYSPAPTPEEAKEVLWVWKRFLQTAPEKAKTEHALLFAWNEFEEGGWLCPTLGANGIPDKSVLYAFAAARRHLFELFE